MLLCTNNEEPICKWQKKKLKTKTKNSKNSIPNTFINENINWVGLYLGWHYL